MDKTVLLQKQVRDNSEDLRAYLQDLAQWEEDMKRKESEISSNDSEQQVPVVRNKVKKVEENKNNDSKDKGKHKKRINSYDYAAWDKFDVDSECEKVDSVKKEELEDVEDNEPSEEYKKLLRDEAVQEKEKGNQFVKNKMWDEAIACYTHSIACDPKDPIFFANRALCFLKTNNLYSAEADCTSALQLDPAYVKALQRRAAAREGLKHVQDAVIDLKRVLELEPHNAESKKELQKLEKLLGVKKKVQENTAETDKPQSSLISSAPKDTKVVPTITKPVQNQKISTIGDVHIPWPERGIFEEIKAVEKKPHQRSKQPLRRIEIIESGSSELTIHQEQRKIEEPQQIINENEFKFDYKESDALAKILAQTSQLDVDEILKDIDSKVVSIDKKDSNDKSDTKILPTDTINGEAHSDDLANILAQSSKYNANDVSADVPTMIKNNDLPANKSSLKNNSSGKRKVSFSEHVIFIEKTEETVSDDPSSGNNETIVPFPIPKTANSFCSSWYRMKNNDEKRFLYLKQIPPSDLPEIFQHALECDVFSDIITILSEWFITKQLRVVEYMQYLSDVKRFSTLIMFTSKENNIALNKIFDYIAATNETNVEYIECLRRKYEL